MIALAFRVRRERTGYRASKQLFGFSILYLFLLFAMLLIDRMSGALGGLGGLFSHFAA
jgi:heme o synthase